jgi:gas vesicle protein
MQQQDDYRRRDDDDGVPFSTQVTCFVIGGIAGAVLALLFAPKSGHELRGDIADVTRKGIDRTRETATQIGSRAGEYYDSTKERATELYSAAADKASGLAGAARDVASRQRGQLSAAIEAGKQAYDEEKRRSAVTGLDTTAPTYYEADKES